MKMHVPKPKYNKGNEVSSKFFGKGIILSRHFDNLLHAKAWRYVIKFKKTPEPVDWLYDVDLSKIEV